MKFGIAALMMTGMIMTTLTDDISKVKTQTTKRQNKAVHMHIRLILKH